jgi:glycosyltransferase involved in cell wall biosynthesis
MKNDLVVSVCMITYNHEPFIAEAIEGVLMQKANFTIELIIGEDCSTDKTREICKEYQQKYPEIIKLQLPDKNKGMMRNFIENIQAAKGKYIALCEGDDYWTDPLKLQKQVDFLEVNPDYALIHTNYKSFIQQENKFFQKVLKRDVGSVFGSYLKNNQIATLTALFRQNAVKEGVIQYFVKNNFLMADYPLWLHIAQFHKVGYLDEITAVYRILPESAYHTQNKVKEAIFNDSMLEIKVFFAEKNNSINLILDDLVASYKHQLDFGFKNQQKDLVVKAYKFLKKYKQVTYGALFCYLGIKYNFYPVAKFTLKVKRILVN